MTGASQVGSALPLRMVAQPPTAKTSWRARRRAPEEPPRVVARGRYAPGGLAIQLDGTPDEPARVAARAYALGLELLAEKRGQALVDEALVALSGCEVVIVEDAEHLAAVRDGQMILDARVACDLGFSLSGDGLAGRDVTFELLGRRETIAKGEIHAGFRLLAALAQLHEAYHRKGLGQREALHRMLDFFGLVVAQDKAALSAALKVLRTPFLDSGNVFALFLESVADAELAKEVDDADIAPYIFLPNAELNARAEAAAAKRDSHALTNLTWALKWRDKWITWLMGQEPVDVPYSQEIAFELLRERLGEDIDAKRRAVHQEISASYDRRAEGDNIERLSRQIEEEGRMIVCGRISRAFGNQTQLLSNATYVDRSGMVTLVNQLVEKTKNAPALSTQVSRLAKLVLQTAPVSVAQLRGALWHFEEGIRQYQSERTKKINSAKEADAEKLVDRRGLERYQEEITALNAHVNELFALGNRLRSALDVAPRRSAAFLILQQRFFPGETQLMALANANRDTHPGKIEQLRDLTRKGGHNRYASEGSGTVEEDGRTRSVSWISKCQHWIEAIPMFIKERIVKVPVVVGGQKSIVERIETEVDQRGMEAFFRFAAQFWAENCDEVVDTEHVAVAREFLISRLDSDELRAYLADSHATEEQAFEHLARQHGLADAVVAVAALVEQSYAALIERVGAHMEKSDVSRFDALRELLLGSGLTAEAGNALAELAGRQGAGLAEAAIALAESRGLSARAKRLARLAYRKRRPISTLHILTTESAGMTEGYVQTWIETEMALVNVIRAKAWEKQVQEKLGQYRTRIGAISEKVIAELGMEAVVQETMAENGAPRTAALGMIMATNRPVAEEIARLAVLIEEDERRNSRAPKFDRTDDPAWVAKHIKAHRSRLTALAIPKVVEANGRAMQQQIEELATAKRLPVAKATRAAIAADADFAADLEYYVRSIARQEVLEELDRTSPELNLLRTQGEYLRNHTQLAVSFARRAVIAEHNAQQLTESPLYNYRAAGGKKRYNLLYTPSRVDLGAEEMDSIVRWNQWVGGADRTACNAGRDFYSLINEAGVEVRPALAWQEIQKTSENANMTAGKAFANSVALLINSVREGDQQLMADQMFLRHDEDRGTPPASEGYGGYCVPKDGLFLAFVLELKSETKLRQMGIPPAMHHVVMALSKEAILHYGDFETDFEWQMWVAKKLLSQKELARYVSQYLGIKKLRSEDVLVFNVTKIAEAMQRLGQPWHEVSDGDTLVGNLAAQWAVGKMIIGGEQVQRFMVFYKAWMIARALARGQRGGRGRVVLPAEYKPVQDIRYSAGNRIFEILAKTGEHLTYSLDEEGQNLVLLMMHGFSTLPELAAEQKIVDALAKGSEEQARRQKALDRRRRVALRVYEAFGLDDSRDQKTIAELKHKFPAAVVPGDIRLVASTMSSTQDIFYYTDDTQLTQIADRVLQILSDTGLSEDQMRANAEVHGGELAHWVGIKDLPEAQRDALLASQVVYRVGADTFEIPLAGAVHALVLRLKGPGRSYNRELQGADVLNTAIAFKEIFDLIDDPAKLAGLMLEGNPGSALALTDGVSGRATRMLTYQDVMMFFAACDTLAGEGRGSYAAIGLGEQVVERLRAEMQAKRQRAADLLAALTAVAEAKGEDARGQAVAHAQRVYARIVQQLIAADEAQDAIAEEERLKRYKRHKTRDTYLTQALTRLAAGLNVAQLDFGSWLALGGNFVMVAQPAAEIAARRQVFEKAVALVPQGTTASAATPATKEEVEGAAKAFVRARFVPEGQKFEQVLGRESSSKAVHAGEAEARERRKALRARQLRTEIFNQREQGFKEQLAVSKGRAFDECFAAASSELEALLAAVAKLFTEKQSDKKTAVRVSINTSVGRFLGAAREGLTALVDELYPTGKELHARQQDAFHHNLRALYTGREIVFEHWKKIAGGYQDMGDIARLILALGNDRPRLERLAKGVELFYTTLAFSQTVEHIQVDLAEVQWTRFWDDVAVFFAETVNDHDCLYLPWNYVRGAEKGVGFDAMSEKELYALAFARHEWLYRYFRLIFTGMTEIRELPAKEQDALLGNFLPGHEQAPIGGNGPTREERAWRTYNQLRETSFMRNDGFAIPQVFPELDPRIIRARQRVNVVFLFPVGRTHISRAFREGPTLNRELVKQGRPGANLIVSRYDEFAKAEGAQREVLHVRSGHLYVTREELVAALIEHKKLSKPAAEAKAKALAESGALTPKGIRLAACFTEPIVAGLLVPYHGSGIYTSGKLEDAGLPYTVQSMVHSDITYDKSLYPEIYHGSGVNMPPEIDWMMAYQKGVAREAAVKQIIDGRDGYVGLRRFAEQYPILLIKGAAESGARNLKVFDVGRGKGAWDEDELLAAATFVFERAGKQNMVIQEAARTTPEFWASQFYMSNFVDRQITEWNVAVQRDRHPRSQIYGSLRIIASSAHPDQPYDLTHLIALASLQVATNVGRGGTLEPLHDQFIQERYRKAIRTGLSGQVPLVMKALDKYAPKYAATFEKQRGRKVGQDLRGVSYGWPGYLMLDYLVTPVFERDGKLADVEPICDAHGERVGSRIVLEDKDGRFEGKIVDWRFIHLEPNVGIGLWDRFNLREEEWERKFAAAQKRKLDWDAIGHDDRIVLRNFAIAGQQYLEANFGAAYFAGKKGAAAAKPSARRRKT